MRVTKEQLISILADAGLFLWQKPLAVLLLGFVAGLAVLGYIWWQNIYGVEVDEQPIFQEQVLRRAQFDKAVEILKNREERFKLAPQKQYQDLFK